MNLGHGYEFRVLNTFLVFLVTKKWSCYSHGCPSFLIKNKTLRNQSESGLPWWSRGKDATLPLQGLLILSLVRDLRSLVEKSDKELIFALFK